MDPILNQTTTTRTTYGQIPRDFSTWSDRELRKELKKYGEKLPRETERSQLLSRLQFFETNQTSSLITVPIVPIQQLNEIPTTTPVITETKRNYESWTEEEMITELEKYGEKAPKETERAELIKRLDVHEKPIQTLHQGNHSTVLVSERTKNFKDLSDRELRKELKKYGEKVPRETERAELLRRLDVHQKSSQLPISSPVKSTVPIIGITHLSTQTHPVTPIQHSGISNQTIPQQTGIPQQSLPGSLVCDEDTKMYNNWSEKEMRRELKKKYGDRVPKNTQRMELIRRLNCCHNNEKNTGYTRVTGLPVQQTLPQQTVPLQQNIPQQFPVQQNQQTGFPVQQNQQTSVPTQKNIPHQTGTNQHY